MVGVVKELVDEAGIQSITNATLGIPPTRMTRFDSIEINPYQVAVRKTQTRLATSVYYR